MAIFEGLLPIRIPIIAVFGANLQTHTLKGTLTYQMCNEEMCFFPQDLDFQVEVAVD